MKSKLFLVPIFLLMCFTACSNRIQSAITETAVRNPTNDNNSDSVPSAPATPPTPSVPTAPTHPDPATGICGGLDFRGIYWSADLNFEERKSLQLALSISGSYEGQQSWQTIANNSDGQGMSLGLLQQNFGAGTLQTMLIQMRTSYYNEFKNYFSKSDFASLDQMLEPWNNGPAMPIGKISAAEELFPDVEVISKLDIGSDSDISVNIKANSLTANSVTWAVRSLYSDSGKTFIPRWKSSFQRLAVSAAYRGIQTQGSLPLMRKAESYFQYFGFKELRSLLLMYDFVVQNGGFTQSHKDQYLQYVKSNPRATETQKAQKLLAIRLVSVRPQYVSDVRARKTTIILGVGTVHGIARNLSKEYCVNLNEIL